MVLTVLVLGIVGAAGKQDEREKRKDIDIVDMTFCGDDDCYAILNITADSTRGEVKVRARPTRAVRVGSAHAACAAEPCPPSPMCPARLPQDVAAIPPRQARRQVGRGQGGRQRHVHKGRGGVCRPVGRGIAQKVRSVGAQRPQTAPGARR